MGGLVQNWCKVVQSSAKVECLVLLPLFGLLLGRRRVAGAAVWGMATVGLVSIRFKSGKIILGFTQMRREVMMMGGQPRGRLERDRGRERGRGRLGPRGSFTVLLMFFISPFIEWTKRVRLRTRRVFSILFISYSIGRQSAPRRRQNASRLEFFRVVVAGMG